MSTPCSLTDAGIGIMRSESSAGVMSSSTGSTGSARSTEARPLSFDEREAFEALRALRKTIAAERGVPSYVVFSDATLRELVKVRPDSLEAMLEVKGIGQHKLEAFGEIFLAELDVHREAGDIPSGE